MEDKIVDAYTVQMLSVEKIAKAFGITSYQVEKAQKKRGIPRRTISEAHSLPVDEDFFSVIDSEEKAYWLGFIYADGYITKNVFGIKLSEDDAEHLEKLKKALKSYHRIGHYSSKWGFSRDHKETSYCSLTIKNEKLVLGLIKSGVLYRKSRSQIFPSEDIVPPHLLHHFVRGYFDGDGSVYGSAKAPAASFDGNEVFISVLLDVIKDVTHSSSSYYKDHSIFCIKLGGKNIIRRLYEYMYADANVFLGRKKQKFEQILT